MPTAFDFKGRVAVVTGVGRVGQIGHAVAEGFARAGAKLVVADRNAVAIAQRTREFAALGAEVRPAAGDLTEPDVARWVIEQALDNFGQVDIVANVAGGLTGIASVVDADTDVLRRELTMNLTTTYLVSREAAKVMIPRKSGAIVNFASIAAFSGKPAMAAYSAAKAAVAAFTHSLALELRDDGIRVNAVAPGTVRTADNRASISETGTRWVEIAEIVQAVLFLASDAASGITGHVLPVARGEG